MLFFLSTISEEEKERLNSLIIKVSEGDRDALGEIYKIAGGRMLSVAMGLMRDKFLAEDVLHDSFIKVVRFSSSYRKNTNAYSWLCTVVKNTAYNKIKSENIRRSANIDDFYSIADDKLWHEDKIAAVSVESALKQLSSRERTIIWLKYYNCMTVRGIAEELGLPRSTIQNTIAIAERKLKNLLKDED